MIVFQFLETSFFDVRVKFHVDKSGDSNDSSSSSS